MKPEIDIIILSKTADDLYLQMLGMTVNSIKDQKDVNSNIILVETNKNYKTKEQYNLPIDVLVVPEEEFNFNRFLNYGLQYSTKENICFSNNDVRYYPHSLIGLIEGLKTYDSVSPFAYGYSEGMDENSISECYTLNKCFFGFCHCITKKAMNECFNGKFDEDFIFWYQDDDIIVTIKEKGFKHGLVGFSKVEHLQINGPRDAIVKGKGANSYILFEDKQYEYLWGQHRTMRKKWKKMLKYD